MAIYFKTSRCGRQAVTSNSMAFPAVKGDVRISDKRHDEGVLQASFIAVFDENIRDFALERRQEGATYDGHDKQGRNLTFLDANAVERQRENIRPADGSE